MRICYVEDALNTERIYDVKSSTSYGKIRLRCKEYNTKKNVNYLMSCF